MMAAAISSDVAEQFTSKSKSSEKKEDEYVKDFEEARKRIEEFELKTSTKFSCWKTETFLKPGNRPISSCINLTQNLLFKTLSTLTSFSDRIYSQS